MHHLIRVSISFLLTGACLASAPAGEWSPLFDGKTLDGWKQINGTATYRVEDGAIVGKTSEGSPNSFLCTKKPYGDFELQFEVLCDPELNSGVQIRSISRPDYQNGRVHGYQVEIEEGEAGYIYDEARRGWLSQQRPKADVFKKGEWNAFRVVCQGDRIRTWINGEPIEDLKDDMTASGFIGLQVHGVARGSGPYQVRWRNIRLQELANEEAATQTAGSDDGWVPLFNGKNLDGWKVNENKDSVVVEDGMLVVKGPRSHAFYAGPVAGAQFKNFEFMADVMTTPGSNSGIYFHTDFQPSGWPEKGYEAQVNNTHGDPKKTGGLYDIKDNYQAPAKDNEWFQYYIKVDGKHVVVKINGKTITDFTEPDNVDRPKRRLGTGTFALQAHDPKSVVYYKNIMVKPMAD
jgi:hypothetical protein